MAKSKISLKKYNDGGDSTNLKSKAEAAGNNLLTADVRKFKGNVLDFAKKQRTYKQSTRKGTPGHDESGMSKFGKMLGLWKKGGSVSKSKKSK